MSEKSANVQMNQEVARDFCMLLNVSICKIFTTNIDKSD